MKTAVDSYIEGFEGVALAKLEQMRQIMTTLLPMAEERIAYGMPTYRFKVNLVHFAAFKNHIGFYPTPEVIEAFKDRLTKYKTSKGAIQFPMEEPLPQELIEEMVRYRAKAVE